MSNSTRITSDEWLKALGEAATPVDQDAMTVGELADKYNIGRFTAEKMIRRMQREGRVTRTRKVVTYTSGQQRRVFAYRLKATATK